MSNALKESAIFFKLKGEQKKSDSIINIIAKKEGLINPKSGLTYSYIVRQLRLNGNEDKAKEFQKIFKSIFDEAFLQGLDNPEEIALMHAIQHFDINYEDL